MVTFPSFFFLLLSAFAIFFSTSDAMPFEKQQIVNTALAAIAHPSIDNLNFSNEQKLLNEVRALLEKEKYNVLTADLLQPDAVQIKGKIESWLANPNINTIFIFGGTTVEEGNIAHKTLLPLIKEEFSSFQSLYTQVNWDNAGALLLDQNVHAGLNGKTFIFLLPNSRKEAQTAIEKIILPQIRNLLAQVNTRQNSEENTNNETTKQ
ncbi:hypothetical protein JYU14_00570 [Simkania negevensis]|uniref:Molybdenum cofactor biosynthesis protein B n=1 Tax=Simkania negevensis TaxID=83561 RepID=A0ABS3AU75_9BACT|nr:hypothetical protein [Simkania negevensis]